MAYQTGDRKSARAAAAVAVCLAIAGGAAVQAEQAPSRVVVARTTTEAETNRCWATAGILGLNPSMQMLLSNDPVTGEYDDQGLAERFPAAYGYDPERAKALLAEAGYPDAFPDPVIPIALTQVPGSPEWATIAELLQIYFEAVGLQTELRESDFASLQALGRARQAYLLNPSRNAPVRPTEVGIKLFYSSTGSATGGLEDDVIEELGNRLQATIDPAEREAIARQAFIYLFEQYADIPVAELPVALVANPRVVAGWTFPGLGSAGVSHWHLIEKAR